MRFAVIKNKKTRDQYEPRALQVILCFGNPAIPMGPVAFRPTITRGLALSAMSFKNFLSKNH
jgi:hypothetical protein